MTTPLRLLYTSNAFWAASGYGVQGRSLLPRLAQLPQFGGRHGIAQFAWYGLEGGMHMVDDFVIYPRFDDPYGNDVIGAHTRDFGANIVVSLIDVWVMQNTANAIAPALWLPWLPIDHDPVPKAFLRSLQGAHLPLTYSQWGHDLLLKEGVDNFYIPHGIEPSIFKVIPNRENVQTFKRQLTELEESHLSVIVAANKGSAPSRKWFEGQLEAFADFAKDKPEARLYVHSDPTQVHGGVNFESLVAELELEDKVIVPDRYRYRLGYPPEYLSMVYNAADVLLSCSMSEGFGIPIIEAQACGTPVVVTNFSAMPELVHWGYAVDVLDRFRTAADAYHAWPSKKDMTDKLNRLYDAWLVCGGDWPISQRLKTSKAIHDRYDWDFVVSQYWAPLMERMAEVAEPLDGRFQAQGVDAPEPLRDDVGSFVEALQEGIREAPQRRVEPYIVEPKPFEPLPLIDVLSLDEYEQALERIEAKAKDGETVSLEEAVLSWDLDGVAE